MRTSIWRELAISPSTDEREIRRAYARRLKIVHPEDDPEGFQALRAAFEQALNHARHAAWEAGNNWHEDDAVDEGLDASAAPVGENHALPPATPSTDASPQDPALVAEMARDRADRDEHQRRCDVLTELLRQPAPDGEEVLTALVAVFRSPALGALDVHDSTEHWLGQLAAQRGPAFEALLEPAIAFFGWDHRPVGDHWNPGLGALQHRADLETIRRLRNPASAGHEAFMILSRPMTSQARLRVRLSLGVKPRIAELLARMDYEFPYLQSYLDAETVAWWREHLSRPRFDGGAFWAVIGVPLLCGFLGWAGADPKGVSSTGLLAGALVGLVVSLVVVLTLHYVFALPRWRISRRDRPLSFRAASGWAPATAALLLTAAAVPDPFDNAPEFITLAALGGLGLCVWALIVVDTEGWSRRLRWLSSWPPVVLPLSAICGAVVAGHQALGATLLIALLILGAGGLHLSRRWPVAPPASRRAGLLLAATAGAGALLAYSSLHFWTAPIALAVLSIATAVGIIASPHQSSLMLRVRRWATPIGVFLTFMNFLERPDLQTSVFAWGGVWIGGVLVLTTLGDLLLAQWPQKNRKRRKSVDRFA